MRKGIDFKDPKSFVLWGLQAPRPSQGGLKAPRAGIRKLVSALVLSLGGPEKVK